MKMNKVCMFVWNSFTNDARVLRECTALGKKGYEVDLICIHDPAIPDLPRYEERDENFKIYRVRRYPVLLEMAKKMYRSKRMLLIIALLFLAFLFYFPIPAIVLSLVGIIFLKTKLKGFWIKGNVILRMILRGFQRNYQIYHSNDLNTLPQGYICAKLRFGKKKLIYDSHEVQTDRTGYNGSFYAKMESFFVTKIDAMIVENDTRAKYNQDLYGFYPYVVHNYPFKKISQSDEKAPIHQMLGLPEGEKILLYQGGIQSGRGLDKLIRAVPYIKEGTLVLVGDGKIKPELKKLVRELNLEERVKFIPKVMVEQLPAYTRNGYIGFQVLNNVCFNHYSASSNKLFEYIMSDVPVIACSFPEIKRVVEGEEIGLCIDSHDHQSIATGVNRLLEDQTLYSECKVNCLDAKEKYNWENEAVNLLEVYRAVTI
ncbi:glycosyltransferase [Pseudalkalibacillus caeni]|uniref:Glycosyltransferase family 4 protein n=1 Tax=Exobacillus caeni TaxID=2574798 RepID=A0A5R9FAI9_9BACL|nr:glycosyltransferase [Pseudalkalibacillus caeni]TLS38678.1 glycosyltransferase family 4 protein [Pseudalkalibacillus caeni]